MRYLQNQHEKDDDDFKPEWIKGHIIERNRNDTGYIICDEAGGFHNRLDVDCCLEDEEDDEE